MAVMAAGWVAWRFTVDLQQARAGALQGSRLVGTRCGPIEYQEAAAGLPLLATPPALLDTASPAERARVRAMLQHILPVSARAAGLRSDTAAGKHLAPAPLGDIRAPTLVISTRDDGYGTFASAQYTAAAIPGAVFLGFERGGHTWVGHDDEVMAAIVRLLAP